MKSLSFFRGLTWLIVLNLLVKPAWIFLIDRQVQNIVGFEVYGSYFAVLNLCLVLLTFADAGLSIMLNQRMAYNKSVNVPQLLRLKILLVMVYAVACSIIAWLSELTHWQLLFYVVLVQALTSFFIFLRSIITANQYFTADAWFSVIDKLLMTILCGSLIYTAFFMKITLMIFLQIQVICTGMAIILAMAFILKKQMVRKGEHENIKSIVASTWPFALSILLMSLHYRLDGFLLERMHSNGATEAGRYAAGYRLLDAGNMVGYLAASFLVPFIARHHEERTLIREVTLKTRHGLICLAIGVGSFTLVFASWIRQLLYHSADTDLDQIIAACVVTLPGYYLVHIYGSVLTATSRLHVFMRILVISVVLNVLLNLMLIPAFGAWGCCIAALVSQYFCGITTALIATKKLGIGFDPRSVVAYVLLALVLGGIFYLGRMVIPNVWIILGIALFICLLLMARQLGLFKKYFILLR